MIVRIRKEGLKKKSSRQISDPFRKLKIWILFPHLQTDDPNLQYYYDFSQSLQEYRKIFEELGADWTWQPVTLENYCNIIGSIKKKSGRKIPLVLNLCDGDEVNGTPGISVIRELERNRLIYTGSDEHYYGITTSKIPMKRAFEKAGVLSPGWEILSGDEESMQDLCNRLGGPVIIKPAVSGGSMGVSVKNVVYTDDELISRVREIRKGYRGWNLLADGLIAERFICGPEYTSFIVGSSTHPESCLVYPPVERIFHSSLPDEEKFLSFDRLWEIYEEEKPMPGGENFYEYHPTDPCLAKAIEQLSLQAYAAVGGMGYGRLDIRMDKSTGKLYVLEVNAQCGLSEDEDYTSIGAILRYAEKTFSDLLRRIIADAFHRRSLTM